MCTLRILLKIGDVPDPKTIRSNIFNVHTILHAFNISILIVLRGLHAKSLCIMLQILVVIIEDI